MTKNLSELKTLVAQANEIMNGGNGRFIHASVVLIYTLKVAVAQVEERILTINEVFEELEEPRYPNGDSVLQRFDKIYADFKNSQRKQYII